MYKYIDKKDFVTEINSLKTNLYKLENNEQHVYITNYGGRIVSWQFPDIHGNVVDIVLGYDTIDEYLGSSEMYYGALIGRYASRIAGGEFTLNDHTYNLAINNPPNHLHGGQEGFHNVVWDAKQISNHHLRLQYYSEDGQEGYPGNLKVMVHFILMDDHNLMINYTAVTDKKTVINLTSHPFFNLGGAASGSINNHELKINADNYTPVDQTLIPTGDIVPVRGTPFDFTTKRPIGSRLDEVNQQLEFAGGYDHNFVLNKKEEGLLKLAAKVHEPISGRVLEVFTTEPGIQFYGGNFLDGSDIGREGVPYESRTAFCLEPQHFPDSPNQSGFPSTVLDPNEIYHSVSVYRLSTK